MVSDAVVTVLEADDLYRPVNRFRSLLRETDRLRFVGFDLALLGPYMDELCQRIIDGMRAEIIDPPSVVTHIRSVYSEQVTAALKSGDLTVRVHDGLPPYGVGIFDDRIAIASYDPTSGTVKVVIDTDTSEARKWAGSIYTTYRRELPTLAIESEREPTPQPPKA